jgi:hypothetical protein
MLACDSEEEFLDCSMSITSKWSEPPVSYFERELKFDIIKYTGKWLLEEFDGLYDPYSGITNNLSESYNVGPRFFFFMYSFVRIFTLWVC